MAALRFVDGDVYLEALSHLHAGGGERFAFFLCTWSDTAGGPSMVVRDLVLVDPSDTGVSDGAWSLSEKSLDRVIGVTASSGLALVEAHNHAIGPPRFSRIDRDGLMPFAEFMLASFPDRPYAATVWAGEHAYGEWFEHTLGEGVKGHEIDRIILAADRLALINERADRDIRTGVVLERQAPVFGQIGQRTLDGMRVAVVGVGGTGSHMVQGLAYLGVRDFVLVDPDWVEPSNLNRLVTGTPADIEVSKADVAVQMIKAISPGASTVRARANLVSVDDEIAEEIRDCDLVVGCVDDDGPRLLLNRLAVSHSLPYIDVATGITAKDEGVVEAGGRIAFVTPAGACLSCTDELDIDEVRAYFLGDHERARSERHGYVKGRDVAAPSVVSLNGVTVHAALNELCLWVAGHRPPASRIDVDLLGNNSPIGPRITPRRDVSRRAGCPECGALSATA